MTGEKISAGAATTQKPYDEGDRSFSGLTPLVLAQYRLSVWLRGDNLPDRAEYLGYLSGKDLYPDFKYTPFQDYIQEVLNGHGKAVYANRGFNFKERARAIIRM
jgi:hypothetical protein